MPLMHPPHQGRSVFKATESGLFHLSPVWYTLIMERIGYAKDHNRNDHLGINVWRRRCLLVAYPEILRYIASPYLTNARQEVGELLDGEPKVNKKVKKRWFQ
jgi:hypothetical protein